MFRGSASNESMSLMVVNQYKQNKSILDQSIRCFAQHALTKTFNCFLKLLFKRQQVTEKVKFHSFTLAFSLFLSLYQRKVRNTVLNIILYTLYFRIILYCHILWWVFFHDIYNICRL